MEIKKESSYGVIPFIKEDGVWKVFLIYQYGSAGDIFWTFPKGHHEEGELPTQTAKRELKEETGISLAHLITEVSFDQSYTFRHEGVTVDKSVTYYIGIAENSSFSLQADEVKEAQWLPIELALRQLTYDSAKLILKEAILHLPD